MLLGSHSFSAHKFNVQLGKMSSKEAYGTATKMIMSNQHHSYNHLSQAGQFVLPGVPSQQNRNFVIKNTDMERRVQGRLMEISQHQEHVGVRPGAGFDTK